MLIYSIILCVCAILVFLASLIMLIRISSSGISIRMTKMEDSKVMQYIHKRQAEQEKEALMSELSGVELFVERMLISGVYTIHDVIGVVSEMTVNLRPYFQRCYNKFFAVGTEAIEEMKDEINIDSFGVLANALIHAHSYEKKEMGKKVGEHIEHLKKLREYRLLEGVNKKETKFAMVLILPLLSFMIVQVYPWLSHALSQLTILEGW